MRKEIVRKEYSPCPICKGDPNCFLCNGQGKYISAEWTEIIISDNILTDKDDAIDAEIELPIIGYKEKQEK